MPRDPGATATQQWLVNPGSHGAGQKGGQRVPHFLDSPIYLGTLLVLWTQYYTRWENRPLFSGTVICLLSPLPMPRLDRGESVG